ncbi:CTP synthase (glutamine hydrolyzing) [Candidatus Micrarchaeota archaeon]|nr:CTP synthase (glutamine hydrolyzing) [Candidatus Micrarchaeota archaeon]MBU1165470.1 CTP synthase (glutamine hydrolyzing) [Candidatus Micrarchaeota archaeon]MBU1887451.1 CTP synthase (glutamine hydrolyzing) [Candidatus Micrarchaeota archaeon]
MLDKTRFIVIAGSIMSGLGKGIVTSSIAKLLQARGYTAIPMKFDGYLNVDCGTMNPLRHGEVFVLDDGTEVDMDFGTYERFLNISLPGACSITGGKLFKTIIEKERRGEYLGMDVQIVPQLTDEIKKRILEVGQTSKADIVLIEVGGTVGDLENGYFLEAMRQLNSEHENVVFIQLTYVPSLSPGEQKTKPTQHATRLLQSLGIRSDIIITREQEKLDADSRKKISLYCNVHEDAVFDDPWVSTVYELPLILEKQNIYATLAKLLDLKKDKEANLEEWKKRVNRIIKPKDAPLKIAIVGKYTAVKDAYVSVREALVHSAAELNCGLEISWVESIDLEESNDVSKLLSGYHGILVPGGYGSRGIEGKINAIRYARENGVPYLGLCLGMQLMVIEFARNVCGLEGANSTEFDKKTKYPVVALLQEQKHVSKMGGTNRLGAYECKLKKGSKVYAAYGKEVVSERHRHRWEINSDYKQKLEDSGLIISGIYEDEDIAEIVEWKEGFGIAAQPHVELKSRLEEPAPMFLEFMKAAKKGRKME